MSTQQPDPLDELLKGLRMHRTVPEDWEQGVGFTATLLESEITDIKAKINALMIPRKEVEAALDNKTMKLEKNESNSDWFFGYGYNQAISDIRSALGME